MNPLASGPTIISIFLSLNSSTIASIVSFNPSPSPIKVVISLKLIPSFGKPSIILILSYILIFNPSTYNIL